MAKVIFQSNIDVASQKEREIRLAPVIGMMRSSAEASITDLATGRRRMRQAVEAIRRRRIA